MYYFAYGSNLYWPQIKQRCPSARFISRARLRDHRLAITRQSRRRRCGTADVLPQAGGEVWGVLYQIDDSDLPALDRFEDGYGRVEMLIDAIDNGCEPFQAWIYIAEKEQNPPLPNALYKRLIVEGARHWQLPEAYVAMLEQLEAAPD